MANATDMMAEHMTTTGPQPLALWRQSTVGLEHNASPTPSPLPPRRTLKLPAPAAAPAAPTELPVWELAAKHKAPPAAESTPLPVWAGIAVLMGVEDETTRAVPLRGPEEEPVVAAPCAPSELPAWELAAKRKA